MGNLKIPYFPSKNQEKDIIEETKKKNNEEEIGKEKIKCICILKEHNKWINCLICLKSKNFASCSGDRSIKIFSGELKDNFKCILKINNCHFDYILFLTELNNENLVSCSTDSTIKIWKINLEELNYELLITLDKHEGDVWKILELKNTLNLVSCSSDKTIKIWKENKEKNIYDVIKEIKGYKLWIESILEIITKDNINYLVSGGGDLNIKFYDINNDFNFICQFDNVLVVHQMSFIQLDEFRICAGGTGNGFYTVINFRNFQREINVKIHSNDIYAMLLLKNGKIITTGKDKKLKISNSITYKKEVVVNNIHDSYVYAIAQLNNKFIATCSDDKKIKIWEILN